MAINLFDRGYTDYKQYDQFCDQEIRFITRLKKNAKTEVHNEQMPDVESNIFSDQEVYLGDHKNGTKMQYPVRLIKTKDSEGKDITFLQTVLICPQKKLAIYIALAGKSRRFSNG